MYVADIKNPVRSLPGIGPAAAAKFAHLNIYTIGELLQFFPRDYEDRTHIIPLAQYKLHKKIHTVAKVTGHDWFGYGRMKTLKILVDDGSAQAELIAFNRSFLQQLCPVDSIVLITGNFAVKYGALQSSGFEITVLAKEGDISDFRGKQLPDSGVVPVYPLTEGLSQKIVQKAVKKALEGYAFGIQNEIPEELIKRRNLLPKKKAIYLIHEPKTLADIHTARNTLIYEELFLFQCTMAERSFLHKGIISDTFDPSEPLEGKRTLSVSKNDFIAGLSPRQKTLLGNLSFDLTTDQIKVITDMNKDIDRGYKERAAAIKTGRQPERPVFTMSRLLQGDVGSGKTLTAFFACLRVIDWGGQCAFMAPTEILARQHAESAALLLEPANVKVAFLTGSISTSGKTQLLKALKEGKIDIAVGTHALFSKNVEYKDLQLAVIDEQHKFGVLQRNAIVQKGIQEQLLRPDITQNDVRKKMQSSGKTVFSPHLLMMSATPIPQTTALTVFGDLDISTIRTMPQGRKPVKTYLAVEGHEKNVYDAVRSELKKGYQAYFVYPAIDNKIYAATGKNNISWPSSENDEGQEEHSLKGAEQMYAVLSKQIYPDYPCALIHSGISEEEQTKILTAYKQGTIRILAATTVVEVGVDVANATCMIIEQADRFGLAQLHQLRGRVGRGTDQSYCFLIYSKNITQTGIARMKALRETTDGFIIAEEDLKLRGPGELTGTIQSGDLALSIADFSRDHAILMQARSDAFSFMRHKLQAGGSE